MSWRDSVKIPFRKNDWALMRTAVTWQKPSGISHSMVSRSSPHFYGNFCERLKHKFKMLDRYAIMASRRHRVASALTAHLPPRYLWFMTNKYDHSNYFSKRWCVVCKLGEYRLKYLFLLAGIHWETVIHVVPSTTTYGMLTYCSTTFVNRSDL